MYEYPDAEVGKGSLLASDRVPSIVCTNWKVEDENERQGRGFQFQ